jgi:hypothetical protein
LRRPFNAFGGILDGSPANEAGVPRKGHSEEQIVFALKPAENEVKAQAAREQESGFKPALKARVADFDSYRVIYLG